MIKIKKLLSGFRKNTSRGERPSDDPEIFDDEWLLRRRIVLLQGPIDDDAAAIVIAKLLYLQSQDNVSRIELHIDSPGGSVAAAFAVVDVLAELRPPVYTICRGVAHGMAAVILASGRKGSRQGNRNGRIGLTPIESGISLSGWSEDQIAKRHEEMNRMMQQLVEHLAMMTGQDESVLRADCERGRIFTPEQAKEYNLIDEVVDVEAWPE